jgi:diguanylate cyclase (GGDEF)-like protein
MSLGLGLITLGTFFDMISNYTYNKFDLVIEFCFTMGAVIFVIFLAIWSNYLNKIIFILHKDACTDPMTGVYNRKGINEIFEKIIKVEEDFCIMAFDLDKVKSINDNFGHLIGDEYIIKTTEIIKSKIGEDAFIGRTGGDEFIAILKTTNELEIEKIKSYIKQSVSSIFDFQKTTISIGHSVYIKDGTNLKILLQLADDRMYKDKKKRQYTY